MALVTVRLGVNDIASNFETRKDLKKLLQDRFKMMGTLGEEMRALADSIGVEISIYDVDARDEFGYPIKRSFTLVKHSTRKLYRFSGDGWTDYKAAHNFEIGDTLSFQFTFPYKPDLSVWIVRVNPALDNDVDLYPNIYLRSPFERSTTVFAQLIANYLNGEPEASLNQVLTYAKNPTRFEEKALMVNAFLDNPSTIPLGFLPNTMKKFRDFINDVQKFMVSPDLINIIEGPNISANTLGDIFPDAHVPFQPLAKVAYGDHVPFQPVYKVGIEASKAAVSAGPSGVNVAGEGERDDDEIVNVDAIVAAPAAAGGGAGGVNDAGEGERDDDEIVNVDAIVAAPAAAGGGAGA